MRAKSIKFLEDIDRGKVSWHRFGNDFLGMTWKLSIAYRRKNRRKKLDRRNRRNNLE